VFGKVLEAVDLNAAADRIASYVLGRLFFVRPNVGQNFDATISERALSTELRAQLRVRKFRHRSLCPSDQRMHTLFQETVHKLKVKVKLGYIIVRSKA